MLLMSNALHFPHHLRMLIFSEPFGIGATIKGKHVHHPMHEFAADQIVPQYFGWGMVGILKSQIFCSRNMMKVR